MINLLQLIFLSISSSWSQDYSDCRFYVNCSDSSRSGARSLPSAKAAANLNPSNISQVKGLGLETLLQANNPVGFSLVSGNGKIGALISPTLENSFFGNRSVEIDEESYLRQIDKRRYKNKKLNLAIGVKVFEKKHAAMDIGFSLKRNPDIKKLNTGVGVSARLAFLSFGAYFYKDDVSLELKDYVNPYTNLTYASMFNLSTYQEKFSVETYTIGTRIKNLTLDAGVIKTRYKFYTENTRIYLYSSSYNYNKFLFNLAFRKEYSPNMKFNSGFMVVQRKKEDTYLGMQYLANKHLMLGVHHNNFLLNEWSATLTLFF